MKNNRLIVILGIALFILSIPFFAMQLGAQGVNWNLTDFIIMGILLFGTGFIIEITLQKIKSIQNRVIACGIILTILFLTWAELAVGIFGTPFAES